jgi:vacuolar protein 8
MERDVQLLLGMINSADTKERVAGVVSLHKLCAKNPEAGACIAEAGAVPVCARLLNSGNTLLWQNALGILRHSASHSASARESIAAQDGCVSKLCSLLLVGANGGPSEDAAAALYAVAMGGAPAPSAAAPLEVAVRALLALLQTGEQEQREQAAEQLKYLAVTDAATRGEVQAAVLRAGGVAALVAALGGGGGGGMASRVVSESRRRLPHAVRQLSRMLSRRTYTVEAAAAAVLAALAYQSPDSSAAIMARGGVPALVDLLERSFGNDVVELAAAAALWNIGAGGSANLAAIRQAEGLAPLVRLLRSGEAAVQLKAAGALAELACDHACGRDIGRLGGVALLLPLLAGDADVPVQLEAATCVSRLVEVGENQQQLLQMAGGVAALEELRLSRSKEVRQQVLGALDKLKRGGTILDRGEKIYKLVSVAKMVMGYGSMLVPLLAWLKPSWGGAGAAAGVLVNGTASVA